MHNKIVYTVNAFKLDPGNHSYILGVYDDINEAMAVANKEERSRQNKYKCEVREWVIGVGLNDSDQASRVIKALDRDDY